MRKHLITSLAVFMLCVSTAYAGERLRVIVETDAGGDPDDQASLVRFLMYANEWDVEGIIADRQTTKNNNAGTGLALVQQYVDAYGQVRSNLVKHDARYPTHQYLHDRTVAGHNGVSDGVDLIVNALESDDPRPLWYGNWGSNSGTASNLKRALDYLEANRTPEQYAQAVSKLRISTLDGDKGTKQKHAKDIPLHIETGYPTLNNGRWYHQFKGITEKAGGFRVSNDIQKGHGPLGALYTTSKEGDSWSFVYLVPTGMNDPEQPLIGSWAGRYGPRSEGPGPGGVGPNTVDGVIAPEGYSWANQQDTWNGTTGRNNTAARWAVALQNDFAARMDWSVSDFHEANHPPASPITGPYDFVTVTAAPGGEVTLDASGWTDPDGDEVRYEWVFYPEASGYTGETPSLVADEHKATITMPDDLEDETRLHFVLIVSDDGERALTRYQRFVIEATTAPIP